MMRTIYITFIFFFLFSCASRKNNINVDAVDKFAAAYFPANEPGGAILIMKHDSIIFSKGYGIADLTTNEPITPKTLFNLGSLSKTFVANAILLLQEQGKLSVEDSLLKYFPDFKNRSIAAKVKIKHLLTHTSGLPDNRHVAEDTAFTSQQKMLLTGILRCRLTRSCSSRVHALNIQTRPLTAWH